MIRYLTVNPGADGPCRVYSVHAELHAARRKAVGLAGAYMGLRVWRVERRTRASMPKANDAYTPAEGDADVTHAE